MTPDELYNITREQWFDFEELRRSGKTNMWGAGRYLGFDFLPIMNSERYAEMQQVWGAEFDEMAALKCEKRQRRKRKN